MLKKSDIVWERDENGELIPQEIELIEEINGRKEKIKCIPLRRGERKKLASNLDEKGNTDKDTDKEIVMKHCIEPKFTDDELESTPWGVVEMIAISILRASGMKAGKNVTVGKANEKVDKDFQDASE